MDSYGNQKPLFMIHNSLFNLLLVFVPTQLGFHFWPEWAHILGRRVDYLSPTVYVTDILIVLILFFWFLERKKGIMNYELGIRNKKIIIYYSLLIILFIAINVFSATSQPVALYKWLKVGEFVLLGLYIKKTSPPLFMIHTSLFIAVFYSSVIAILQFVFQHSLGLWIIGERTFFLDTPGIARAIINGKEILRPYATFPHPNVLAGFLAATLILLLFQKSKKYYPTIFFGFLALFLTFSRSAWIAALIGLGFVKKNFFLPLLLVVFIILFRLNITEESFVVRGELNEVALRMWQSSPLVGVGLGNYLVELPKYLVSRDVYFLQPVHNIYLLILAETGVIGLGVFVWIIMRAFKKFNLSLFILLLLGLVDHYPITLQQGQLLLTIFLVLQ